MLSTVLPVLLDRARLYRAVQRAGGPVPCDRLAEQLALPASHARKLARELCRAGFLRELPARKAAGARHPAFAPAEPAVCTLGVRLLEDGVSLVLCAPDGAPLAQRLLPHPAPEEGAASVRLLDAAEALLAQADRALLGVGLTCEGPVVLEDGLLRPCRQYGGLPLEPLAQELADAFGVPVFLGNDAQCGGLFCLHRDAAFESGISCYVAAGRSILCATFVDGRYLAGNSAAAGLLGHTSLSFRDERCYCGNRGCLEGFASTSLLESSRGGLLLGGLRRSMRDVAADYRAGEPDTVKEIDNMAGFLAMGLVNLVNLLNPGHIVLGGEFARLGDVMKTASHAVLKQRVLPEAFDTLHLEVLAPPFDEMAAGAALGAFDLALAQKKLAQPGA